MSYAPRNTLTTKLAILTGLLSTFIIGVTGLIFTTSYKFLVERETRNYLVREGEEVISEQIVYDSGVIKYRLSSSGEDLTARLRGYDISAVIFDAGLNRLGAFGIYKNLSDSDRLSTAVPQTLLLDVLTTSRPAFSAFVNPTGINYDTYTTPVTSAGRVVGIVQFAKESDFKSRILSLNLTTLAFLLPLVILTSWFIFQFIIRRSLAPLNQLITHFQNTQPHHYLKKITLSGRPTDEITELVHTFNDLLDKIADSLNRQKDFIAHASHELRTPLTQAISSLDLALHYQGKSQSVQYTAQVKQDLLELNQTLDSLLLLSRLDDPLAPLPPAQDVDLRRLLNEIVNNYSPAIQSKKLQVAIDCPAHPRLHFPKDHLQILLSNLVSNAVKYNAVSGRLEIAAVADSSTIRISVSDTGPGIPEAEQPRIFEKFYRGKTASASGTGLGLSLVKRICDLHHLDITLSSSASGTVFILAFPAIS